MPASDPYASLAADVLRLDDIRPGTFRSHHGHDNTLGAVFGGQFLAQGVLAATRSASGWPSHSCSAYFMRPGKFDAPLDYEVESVRDGRSFANRRVIARQSGKVLFDMLSSHRPAGAPGPAHQIVDTSGIPPPESLPDLADYLRANGDRIRTQDIAPYLMPLPVEFRLVDPDKTFHLAGKPDGRGDFWLRFPSARSIAELSLHQALIAFVSDFWLGPIVNELRGPPYPAQFPIVTVSHTLAFHGSARADDWLLYRVESPFAAAGLGFARGMLFDRHGSLVASTTQEVLNLR